VHFEVDVPNRARTIPVGTTAELAIDVGEPVSAIELPLLATTVRGSKASLFVVEDRTAHARVLPLLGEREGTVYVAPELEEGARVVTEGRALLNDGDKVRAQLEHPPASVPSASASAIGRLP
jgi:hypothetical protein